MERIEVQDMTISQGEVRMLNEILHSPVTRIHEAGQPKIVFEQPQVCVLSDPPMVRNDSELNQSYQSSKISLQTNSYDTNEDNEQTTPQNTEYIMNDMPPKYLLSNALGDGHNGGNMIEQYSNYQNLERQPVYQISCPRPYSSNSMYSEMQNVYPYKQAEDGARSLPPISPTPLVHPWPYGLQRCNSSNVVRPQQYPVAQPNHNIPPSEPHQSTSQHYQFSPSYQQSSQVVNHAPSYHQPPYEYHMQELYNSSTISTQSSSKPANQLSMNSPLHETILKKPPRTCKFADCMKTIQRHGLCHKHGGVRKCTKEGCTRKDRGEGFCVAHGGGKRCAHQGCEKVVRRGVYCLHHSASSNSSSIIRAA